MLNGEKITLRPMEESDMPEYQKLINSDSISSRVVGWGFPVSFAEQCKWFANAVSDQRNRRFTVVSSKEPSVIYGMISLTAIDWHNRTATIGLKLNESSQKKGIGTEALQLMMKYAIEQVNLRRLEASWLADNEGSERLYLKCGWQKEGVRKAAIYRNGKYIDLIEAAYIP